MTEEELIKKIRNHTVAGNVAVANGLVIRARREWRVANAYQERLEELQSDGRGSNVEVSSGHPG